MDISKVAWLFVLMLPPFAVSCSILDKNREVVNLTAFAKVYGHVKYFHPSDEASQIDWDKLAIYGSRVVKEAKNEQELKSALESIFLPIAPTLSIQDKKPVAGSFKDKYIKMMPQKISDLTTTAWQHLGLGAKGNNPPYSSERTNTYKSSWEKSTFIKQDIDVNQVNGNKVKLTALIKKDLQGKDDYGELLIIIDGNKKINTLIKQKGNIGTRSTRPDKWTLYEVKTELNEKIYDLDVGVSIHGIGTLLIDDITFETMSDDNGWEKIPIKNNGFTEQTDGLPTAWDIQSFGKFETTVKQDSTARDDNILQIKSPMLLFDRYAEIGETAVSKISEKLWSEVPIALYRDNENTLPISNFTKLNKLKKELEKIDLDSVNTNNANVRAANIIITWNVFQHFYPYFDVVNSNWEEQLPSALQQALSDESANDFYFTLSKLLANLGDGHINIFPKPYSIASELPLDFGWIENQVVVTHSNYSLIFAGDIVKYIDNVPAKKIINNKIQLISGSSQHRLARAMRRFGEGRIGSNAKVTIARNDSTYEFTIRRPLFPRTQSQRMNDSSVIRQIEEELYYINLDRVTMDQFNVYLNKIIKAKGVIFDLRGYPRDNITPIFSMLLNEADSSDQWMQIPQIAYPDQQKFIGYKKFGWNLEPILPKIKGKIVFITDARAISASESYLSFVEHYKLGEIVGKPTSGANGNVNYINLPGRYSFKWTGMRVVKHDGSQHHLLGIQPTIPAIRTIQGVIDGRDEFLEKAIEVLKEKEL